jgi:general secretion pathway protein A
MTKTALLREILQELEVPLPEGFIVRTQVLLKLLHDHVIEMYHHNRKLVILIDECHFLSASSLHMIRTLSNIEVPEQKLLTCLLFAEDSFLRRLSHYSYESLRNRMYLRGELPPLGEKDTAEYVKFRLMVAGCMHPLFDEEALGVIHERSGGISRRINRLCMLSLLEGFFRRKNMLDAELVTACADGP